MGIVDNFAASKDITLTSIETISEFLNQFAPTRLAEDWDNVGLILGDSERIARKVMTCLTITQDSVAEAIEKNVDLIVSHHPLPFRPTKRITTSQTPTRLIWELAQAGISVYSPHTGFDSAADGINQMLATRIGLKSIKPMKPIPEDEDGLGAGRIGKLASPTTFGEFAQHVKSEFKLKHLQVIGDLDAAISKAGVACGSGGSFLSHAAFVKCDCFVTGEATFHTCLEAEASSVNMILLGHYHSERFAVEILATKIAAEFAELEVWPSEQEHDPITFV